MFIVSLILLGLSLTLPFSSSLELLSVLIQHNLLTTSCLFLYITCIYTWCRNGNRVLSLFNLFVLYSCFSNLGQSILYMFNIPVEFLSLYEFSSLQDINSMLIFQCQCIAGLNLGAALYLRKPSRIISVGQLSNKYSTICQTYHSSDTDSLLKFLYVISTAVVFYYAFKMLLIRQHVDYGTFYQEQASWGNIITDLFTLLYAVLSIYYFSKKRYLILTTSMNILLVLIFMIVGARSVSLRYLCLLIITIPIIYPSIFKKRYLPVWIFAFLLFMGFLSAISSARTSSLASSSIQFSSGLLSGVYESVSEMGMSARTSVLTMQAVDMGFPHHQTILVTIINAFVPFVSSLPFLESQSMVCSEWISSYANSYHSGLGYSFIAEMYLNFGWMGWMFMILYGYFISFAENYSFKHIFDRRNVLPLLLLSFLSRQVFYARAEFAIISGTLRILFYFAILVYIWRLLKSSRYVRY